jgi:hypothetical protein
LVENKFSFSVPQYPGVWGKAPKEKALRSFTVHRALFLF